MKAEEILQKHNLVRTSCRQSIINTIAKSGHAVSEDEIKHNIEATYDRTTFYRSLKTLIKKNIIHKIVVDNQVIKYALNDAEVLNTKHVHFYCNQCKTVECLPDVELETPLLPAGYKETETELVVKGLCRKCNC